MDISAHQVLVHQIITQNVLFFNPLPFGTSVTVHGKKCYIKTLVPAGRQSIEESKQQLK